MRRLKFLEIRDRATFIPAVAIDCSTRAEGSRDNYLLRRAGYGERRCILLTSLHGGYPAYCDLYYWGNRTWKVAHQYIEDNWDTLSSGDVVDVEFILGETTTRKLSERHTAP